MSFLLIGMQIKMEEKRYVFISMSQAFQ